MQRKKGGNLGNGMGMGAWGTSVCGESRWKCEKY